MLKSLNSKQKEAVLHDQGPLLILAGAGSGKTRALTHRLAYLVKERKISPINILCLTFTNKAANEMKERVVKLLKNHTQIPWMGTFHSICAKILRREIEHLGQGFTSNFSIYDEDDALSLIKKIIKEKGFDIKKFAPQTIRTIISSAKNELISAGQFKNMAHRSNLEKISAKVYLTYEKELESANALDFDNLINKTIELFKILTILTSYQHLFKYILVDEYQDTNHAQYILLKRLAQKHKNICVVGDDWQSIYRFRGADFRNILEFRKDYETARIIKLEENYRSTANIINAAQSVIENNTLRSEKKLFTSNQKGEKVKILSLLNHEEESEFVVGEIKKLKDLLKYNYNHSVVLYRTNAQSRALEEILIRYNIPYRIIGGVRFYERREIKDVLSYLKFLNNPADVNSLRRIINTPPRGISITTLRLLSNKILLSLAGKNSQELDEIKYLTPRVRNSFAAFSSLMQKLKEKTQEFNVAKFIPILLKETGYKDYILDGTEEGESRFENIKELISVASNHTNLSPAESLSAFLEETSLIADIDNYDQNAPALTLMTLHNAKGLEFDNVFIIGMEEGIFPHSRSLFDLEEIEEERRLCYVGMTRARERLYLLRAQERLLWGVLQSNPESRFLDEIKSDFTENISRDEHLSATNISPDLGEESQVKDVSFDVGDKIVHPNFGEGEVIVVNDDEVEIRFLNAGKKRLSIQYAPLKKLET
jgi:DNA helicase-2/ATP-dependent DNA helicase PcrA